MTSLKFSPVASNIILNIVPFSYHIGLAELCMLVQYID